MKSSLLFTFAMPGIVFGVYGQMPEITLNLKESENGGLIVFRS